MLAWIDLEMTGLDPSRHVVVEIATIVTDDQLEIVAEGPDLVLSATEAELSEMDDYVSEMHARSGLTEAIKASTISRAQGAEATLAFLRKWIPEADTVPLAGNSIGTDRRFLAVQMPEVEGFLHYRCIDVSSIKELARRWAPDLLAGAPEKKSHHRALDDIKESIAELDYYRRSFFILPAGPEREQ